MKYYRIIRYPGAKWQSLRDINEVFLKSNAETFIDVFGGSGNVSLNVNAKRITYNEINSELFNIFFVIKNEPEKLLEKIKRWKTIVDQKNSKTRDPVERAIISIYEYNVGFGGLGKSYRTEKEKGGLQRFQYSLNRMPAIISRVSSWELSSVDWTEVFRNDERDAFFYVDPPYPGKKWYVKNFNEEDYKKLKDVLDGIEGSYLINFESGNPMIERIFGNPSFTRKYDLNRGKEKERKFTYLSFYYKFRKE
ncbi:DNA adenine methylase [Caldiplasma sukawensis]